MSLNEALGLHLVPAGRPLPRIPQTPPPPCRRTARMHTSGERREERRTESLADRRKRLNKRDGARKKKGKTTKCEICDEVMKPDDFNEHMAQHLAAGKGGRGEFYLN